MKKLSRKPLLALFAVGAVLVMPLALAQSPTTSAPQSRPVPPPAAASIAPEPTTPAHATPAQSPPSDVPGALTANTTDQSASTTESSPTAAASRGDNKKTWSELDADKDGNLSRAEAKADPGLNKIFAKADSNADGVLTPDEYKAYVAANYQASSPRKKGG